MEAAVEEVEVVAEVSLNIMTPCAPISFHSLQDTEVAVAVATEEVAAAAEDFKKHMHSTYQL